MDSVINKQTGIMTVRIQATTHLTSEERQQTTSAKRYCSITYSLVKALDHERRNWFSEANPWTLTPRQIQYYTSEGMTAILSPSCSRSSPRAVF